MTVESPRAAREIASGFLRIATVGLALFLLAWLLFRPPFTLAPLTAPTGLTVAVQSGTTGAQQDESGTLWWISTQPASIGLANNTPDVLAVDVSMRVTNGPCSVERTVDFVGRTTTLSPGGAAEVSSGPMTLDGYERVSLDLVLDGAPCAPTETEPRPLYVKLTALDVAEVEE